MPCNMDLKVVLECVELVGILCICLTLFRRCFASFGVIYKNDGARMEFQAWKY